MLAAPLFFIVWNVLSENLNNFEKDTIERKNKIEFDKQWVSLGVEVQQFKLIELTSPKHVYATLEDKNGNVYNRIYVSKHCSQFNSNQLGDYYNLKVEPLVHPVSHEKKIIFLNLSESFC